MFLLFCRRKHLHSLFFLLKRQLICICDYDVDVCGPWPWPTRPRLVVSGADLLHLRLGTFKKPLLSLKSGHKFKGRLRTVKDARRPIWTLSITVLWSCHLKLIVVKYLLFFYLLRTKRNIAKIEREHYIRYPFFFIIIFIFK